MTAGLRRLATVGVAAASMGFGMALVSAGPAHAADPTDIVINEMMTKACAASCQAGYAPVDAAYEFIELYNRGADDIDVSGWAFTAGISLDPASNPLNAAGTVRVFPPGTVIHSHQYFVGSSNGAVFNTVSGQTADFSFAPSGLSSSGENVTLVDAAGATVESLDLRGGLAVAQPAERPRPVPRADRPLRQPDGGRQLGRQRHERRHSPRAELVLRPAATEHHQRRREPGPSAPDR